MGLQTLEVRGGTGWNLPVSEQLQNRGAPSRGRPPGANRRTGRSPGAAPAIAGSNGEATDAMASNEETSPESEASPTGAGSTLRWGDKLRNRAPAARNALRWAARSYLVLIAVGIVLGFLVAPVVPQVLAGESTARREAVMV